MRIEGKRLLVTGGAGFIGSNLCEDLLKYNNEVICLDNFSTGFRENIDALLPNKKFKLIEGDIRNLQTCIEATKDIDIVFHQAALGSVPRSIADPITTNEVNISGFLNMLIAARDNKVQKFVYAASSSTYGDSENLPKVEEIIGRPLSPYAVTKYANELYAHVFSLNFDMDIVGLRYFNVYGRRQNPNGAYAAVIPKFTMLLMDKKSPIINGDGTYSRDFTYIDNIIQINHLAGADKRKHKGEIFNAAVGERNDLNMLVKYLKKYLAKYDSRIADVEVIYGENRIGDIPHSLASIEKAKKILDYNPTHNLEQGLEIAVDWYWNNLRN